MTTDKLTQTETPTVEEQAQVVLHRVQQVLYRLKYLATRSAGGWSGMSESYSRGHNDGALYAFRLAQRIVSTVFGLQDS